ncbi:MAG: hypothetical protein WCT08_01525 [Patescibacteria group bacterium]|jgi:hypothetical protein
MLLSVHVLAGSTISLAIGNPVLSAPICFATHFILDALPHWNYPIPKKYTHSLKTYYKFFGPDLVLTILIEIILLTLFRRYWYFILWGSFWSALPDYLTLYKNKKPYKTLLKGYFKFHDKVQFEVDKASGIALQSLTVGVLIVILSAII